MLNVIYSDIVKEKLDVLKEKLIIMQGEEKAKKIIEAIVDSLDNLGIFQIGDPIKDRYSVNCPDDWYILYSNMNYFVFKRTDEQVIILQMFDYRQDFIYELFGIKTWDSSDYWDE
jgi:plasmid stabilization system protein ParE